MLKERVQRLVVGLVVILLVASALGYLLVPSAMLGIVGMDTNPQVTFLVRTLAAALLALSPAAWTARRRDGTSGQRSVLIGLAGYLFASSLVDLYGFINQVVGVASVPSIALRVIRGAVLVWLIPGRDAPQPSRPFGLGRSAGPTDRWTSRPTEAIAGRRRIVPVGRDPLQLSRLAARPMATLGSPRSAPTGPWVWPQPGRHRRWDRRPRTPGAAVTSAR